MAAGATIAINAHILLTGLSCLILALSACTTTYSESDVANEPLDESASEADGNSPNCSILADQPGCEMESPFDPQDDEQEF